jgi:molecular chaperone DnaK (HSP70)
MKHFTVGIDLGTTNTVAAYAESGGEEIRLFEIEQLSAPGEVKAAAMLPSLRYQAAPGELAAGALRLPWPAPPDSGPDPAVIGMLARRLGAQVPGRLVASAKSWLSHAAVDRLAPILPWGAGPDVAKISPVEASASYLAHVRAAWNWRFPDSPLEQQEVVLTVPASFDEGARALTVQAAARAGLPQARLVEEPQAAFYDWLFRHRDTLASELAESRLILVCDVGGGTTDLTLIRAGLQGGQPHLARIAVGKHLMLGGDNMDLVLAHTIEARLAPEAGAGRLSAARLSQLLERCRAAKEELLAANAPERATVTLLGFGSRLIGGARSVELTRAEVEHAIVDGFFPMVGPDEPAQPRRGGIVEFGLPYAGDPAITRHIAGFLQRHAAEAREALGGAGPPVPDTLLLNGGVFRASALSRRLQEALAAWRGGPLRLLHNENPDIAVARGAVAYALARGGRGPKIGGGSARSYFLLLDARADAGRAIRVLPRGSEEGREIVLQDRVFALRVGRPVRFHLVSSTGDEGAAQPGELVDAQHGDFVRLPPIATVLPAGAEGGRQEVPVRLATALTEVGTLAMHCVALDDPGRRWLLEFQLRGDSANQDQMEAGLPPRAAEAIELIERIFGTRRQAVPAKEVRQLRAQLERVLGARTGWSLALLRRLADALLQRARGRKRSADHEKAWLNLAGYCLRPGFGDPLDGWRIGQLWPLFEPGLQHGSDHQVRAEWWTMWRRVAGGLEREAQLRLLDDFAFNVQADEAERRQRPAALAEGSDEDMLRLAAALERIPAGYKAEIGEWLLGRLAQAPPARGASESSDNLILWTLARLGARQPFYGSAHDAIPPETAAAWLDAILALDWKRLEAAPFAAAHIARLTGDRARDIAPEQREQLVRRLTAGGAPPAWVTMLQEAGQLDEAGERRFLGDTLPPGLKLIR